MEFNEILELRLEQSNVIYPSNLISKVANLILGDAVSGKLHFLFLFFFLFFDTSDIYSYTISYIDNKHFTSLVS